MRDMGVRGLLIYCAETTAAATRFRSAVTAGPDDERLSDFEPRFIGTLTSRRGLRPALVVRSQRS
jgi:hypothetical protein